METWPLSFIFTYEVPFSIDVIFDFATVTRPIMEDIRKDEG